MKKGITIAVAAAVGLVVLVSAAPNPSAGPAQVGDEGELEFLLVLGR